MERAPNTFKRIMNKRCYGHLYKFYQKTWYIPEKRKFWPYYLTRKQKYECLKDVECVLKNTSGKCKYHKQTAHFSYSFTYHRILKESQIHICTSSFRPKTCYYETLATSKNYMQGKTIIETLKLFNSSHMPSLIVIVNVKGRK